MACCIAVTLMVSLVRAAWFFVTGRQPADVGFAPPAHRPGPGQPASIRPASASTPQRRPARRREIGHQLILIGLTWFAGGVVGMHVFGWFEWAHASVLSDVLFHASGIWLATVGAGLLALHRLALTEVTA